MPICLARRCIGFDQTKSQSYSRVSVEVMESLLREETRGTRPMIAADVMPQRKLYCIALRRRRVDPAPAANG
jgi:hypothetical protein